MESIIPTDESPERHVARRSEYLRTRQAVPSSWSLRPLPLGREGTTTRERSSYVSMIFVS